MMSLVPLSPAERCRVITALGAEADRARPHVYSVDDWRRAAEASRQRAAARHATQARRHDALVCIIAAVIIAALILIAARPAGAHDTVCSRPTRAEHASCRWVRIAADVSLHALTAHGAAHPALRLRTRDWGPHSWRGAFTYWTGDGRGYTGSVLVSSHTGRAYRWREHRVS